MNQSSCRSTANLETKNLTVRSGIRAGADGTVIKAGSGNDKITVGSSTNVPVKV